MTRALIALAVAVLVSAGCSEHEQRPLADGYTLHGVLLHAETGDPLEDVEVLVGWEGSLEFDPFAVTDQDGEFIFQPSPNSGPSGELFRFVKPGFVSRDVLARTAVRLEEPRYLLAVRFESESIP